MSKTKRKIRFSEERNRNLSIGIKRMWAERKAKWAALEAENEALKSRVRELEAYIKESENLSGMRSRAVKKVDREVF